MEVVMVVGMFPKIESWLRNCSTPNITQKGQRLLVRTWILSQSCATDLIMNINNVLHGGTIQFAVFTSYMPFVRIWFQFLSWIVR